MIHSQADATTIKSGAVKNYVIAVLIGALAGGAYAMAGHSLEPQAQVLVSRLPPARPAYLTKSLGAATDCSGRMAAKPRGVVAALPMFLSGGDADRYVALGAANISEPVCTWAI